MAVFLALMIGIAVNLDNFLIGMNLGLRGQKLTIKANLLIGMTTGICAFLATYFAQILSGNFMVYANFIGAVFMILFGYYCLVKDTLPGNAIEMQEIEITEVSLKETLFLGCVLAINCIPPAFSAGAMELSPFSVSFFCILFSCLCMHISNRMGHKLVHYSFISVLTPLSSILLIGVGIIELILI